MPAQFPAILDGDKALKILWVKAGGLLPLDTGGKIRSYHMLGKLSCRHDVTFFTFYAEHANDSHGELGRLFTRVISYSLPVSRSKSFGDLANYARHFFSGQPYQIVKYCQAKVAVALRELLKRETFDLIVCDFLVAAGIIPWNLPCPKVLFTHNVEALIWKRHFEVTRSPLWKAISWREWRTTARAERRYLNLADHVLTVSDADRDCFARLIERAKITVIPTGVDVNFFQPAAGEEQLNALVFTGSMDWMPNEDGVFYFVEKILPRIRNQVPDIALLVVGRRPSARLLELSRATAGMQVTGAVEDIRPYVLRGSVYIVPLRVGSGTRLKIFEAMAMGKAVVSTSIGAEGLPVRPGRDIMIADSPDEFALAVVGLLQDHARRGRLGRAARELVVQGHTWDSVGYQLESVLETVVKTAHKDIREQLGLEMAGSIVLSEEKGATD
jgi:sugar transferase (PEP-CTERM/EpsH1 system associated)